jgi:FkbM family methyltransferase
VSVVKRAVRRVAETILRRRFVSLGAGSFALAKAANLNDAWYSQQIQMERAVREFDVDLVIDVGANRGQFATSIRRFYAGTILSFEPVSAAFDELSRAAAADPDWHAHKLALGDQDAEMTIHVPSQTEFSSLLAANDYSASRFGAGSMPTKEEVIAVRRLDEVLEGLAATVRGKRIFLKLDTQGYDSKVFRGLGSRVEDVVAMLSEMSLIPIYEGMPHWTESISLYEAAGFGVVGLYPVTHDRGRVIEYDCLLQRSFDPAQGTIPVRAATPEDRTR